MMTLKFDGSGATGQIQDLESLLGEHAAHVPPEFVDNLTVLLEGLTESPHFDEEPTIGASSSSAAPWPGCEPFHSRPDGARPPLTRQPTQRPRKLAPAQSASASCRVLSRHLPHHSHCKPPSAPPKAPATAANLPSTRIRARIIAPVTPSPPSAVLTPSIPVHRWIRV